MSQTQRGWISTTAAPLQRLYGVEAISKKYQFFFLKMGEFYFIATLSKYLQCRVVVRSSHRLVWIQIYTFSQLLRSIV